MITTRGAARHTGARDQMVVTQVDKLPVVLLKRH